MGEYSHSIDAKGRLIIPAKFREELGDMCIITIGLDKCLTVYTKSGWDQFSAKLAEMASGQAKVRAVKRYFFGNAADVEFDKQGRILLPAHLRKQAGLEKEAVIVGVADTVEIWSREKYDEYVAAISDNMESIAESLTDFTEF